MARPTWRPSPRRCAGCPAAAGAVVEVGSDAEDRPRQAGDAVQAVALLVFAALAALTGLLVVGQGIARQVQLDAGDPPAARRSA